MGDLRGCLLRRVVRTVFPARLSLYRSHGPTERLDHSHVMNARTLFTKDRLIWWLLALAAALRVAALANKGVLYDGGFGDAIGYLDSARTLADTGRFTFYGQELSARVMPGFVILLVPFVAWGGSQFAQYFAIKLALLLVSLASIYVLYLLGRRIGGVWVGLGAASMLALSMPHLYVGTLVLTENPFTLAILLATLFTIRLADEPGWRRFFPLVACFLVAVYLRQAATGFLFAAFVYLLVRRFPTPLLIKQVCVAVLLIPLALSPWWVRNYRAFDSFVPFTSYEGAPLFEGTYQRFEPYGTGAFDDMAVLIADVKDSEVESSKVLTTAARERLAAQWAASPLDVVWRYAITKPAAAWLLPFYWDRVFSISGYWVLRIHAMVSAMGLLALAWLSLRSPSRAEFLLLLINVLVITVGAGYYLGLGRYTFPYMPFLYIGIAYGAQSAIRAAARRRAQSENA